MRVFLGTNVLVSAFVSRGLSADVFRLVISEHELLTGEVNLAELDRVLREKIKLPAQTIREIDQLLREQHIIPKPRKPSPVKVKDPDDRWVLASAVEGNADVLATGDKNLLDVAAVAPLSILDPRGFWNLVRKGPRY